MRQGFYSKKKSELKKLFYLQKINQLSQYSTDSAIIAWRNQLGENGLEIHLQYFGVSCNASALLQSVQFAEAVYKRTPPPKKNFTPTYQDFFNKKRCQVSS